MESHPTRGVRSSDPDRYSHSMRVLPSYHIREYRTMRLETAYSVRSKRHEFCIHQAFTFTNASESPDASSLLTRKISFGKWSINSVHSVKPHSFSSDNATLPPSFNQIDCNTPTGNTPLNLTFFATSTVTYDENTPPLERGDASKSTREVYCPRCDTYVKHGQEQSFVISPFTSNPTYSTTNGVKSLPTICFLQCYYHLKFL